MIEPVIIRLENDLLRSELGSNPLYQWKHTSKLRLRIQKVVESATSPTGMEPKYDYIANPRTGLVELSPVYVDMPMLPGLLDNWVLCRFVQADQDEVLFKRRFGNLIAYPADGIWQPIQATALKPGLLPNRSDTWAMIHGVRANAAAVRDWIANEEERQDKREAAEAKRFGEICRDRFTAQMELPGKKGATSFFNAKPSESVDLKRKDIQ